MLQKPRAVDIHPNVQSHSKSEKSKLFVHVPLLSQGSEKHGITVPQSVSAVVSVNQS